MHGKTDTGRRRFLRNAALLGGTSFFASVARTVGLQAASKGQLGVDTPDYVYHHNDPENIIFSTCLQCHTACPIKCKLHRFDDGSAAIVKIDGNPYCPQTLFPSVPYRAGLGERIRVEELYHRELPVAQVEGRICPKGQAGIQTQYDPYRLRKVLKRVGPRGSRRWKTISFEQAVQEIVEGGDLFGEGHVPGLRELYAVRDPELSRRLAEDARRVGRREMTVEEFQQKHREHLNLLIDPDHPDLGPKNNQFVFLAGRIEHGRKELMKRYTHDAFGSVNAYEHTTICEQSHHIAFEMATRPYADGKWGKGKTHMKPDFENADFVVFFGTGAFEANFGPPLLGGLVSTNTVERGFKYAVIDPRCSRTAGKAWKWVPIAPGGDLAFAMGMMRWMVENDRIDRRFLEAANQAAADQIGETAFTTATYLVKFVEDDAGVRPGPYLRASEVVFDGKPLGTKDQFVVRAGGRLVPVSAGDASGVFGELEGSAEGTAADGTPWRATTAFSLWKQRLMERSLEEYAELAGVDDELGGAATIAEVAREFTSHGKRAVAEFYRGPAQHTNGYYQCQGLILLNLLVGNCGWKGGWSAGGGHFHESGGKPANPFDFARLHPHKLTPFGPPVSKEKTRFEETTLFDGQNYDAKRPWYPFTSNVYHEVIPAAGDGYPYRIGCLFLHKGTPAMSCPAGHKQIEILRDPKKIPLFVACDIAIAETSMYADYIIPDLSIWERWGTPHVTPALLTRTSKVRQPVAAPVPEIVEVDGEPLPVCMETFLIAVAKRLGLSGFGKDGFGPGMHFDRPEDFYLKMVANIASGDSVDDAGRPTEAAPPADEQELELFRKARRHLPPAVFDEAKWRRAVGGDETLWRRVITVLNRGGNFEDWQRRYDGEKQRHAYRGPFNFYVEPVALQRNATNGEPFDGLPRLEPIRDARGNVIDDRDYPFWLSTYKDILGGQSRTSPADGWLTEIFGDEHGNRVLINRRDAQRLGLRHGDRVRLTSATLPEGRFTITDGQTREITGIVQVMEGIRPGTVSVSWHFGHWAYGSDDVEIDGEILHGDPSRARGINPNPLMREDTSVGNVCLTDLIGGSASFFDTRVRIEKVQSTA